MTTLGVNATCMFEVVIWFVTVWPAKPDNVIASFVTVPAPSVPFKLILAVPAGTSIVYLVSNPPTKLPTVIALLVVVDASYIINSSEVAGVAPKFVWPTIFKPTTGSGPSGVVIAIPSLLLTVEAFTDSISPVVISIQLPAPSKY